MGRKRTYFHITPEGMDYYQQKCAEWMETKQLIDRFTLPTLLPSSVRKDAAEYQLDKFLSKIE